MDSTELSETYFILSQEELVRFIITVFMFRSRKWMNTIVIKDTKVLNALYQLLHLLIISDPEGMIF